MNATIDFPSDSSKTCDGKCIKEMQKILEPSVIMEFLEVIRDFHNDDRTATKLKNMILSETSEGVKLLKERASEMILMVDEIFLNRRQRQTSFYRLCHKLARNGLPEGSHLPDESKCVCFSEENLRQYSVDPGASTNLDFSSNLASVKEALKKYFGELRCTDCGRFFQLCPPGGMLTCVSDCSCSSPSLSSQHKVHEAILEACEAGKGAVVCRDSWSLTQLKRDADYYRSRSRVSSLSDDSFEVISPPGHANLEDAMDNESLGSDFSVPEKVPTDVDKLADPLQKGSNISASTTDIQHLSKNLNNKLVQRFSTRPSTANLTDASKRNTSSLCKEESKADMKSSPAFLLRQSFSPYFNKRHNAQKYRSAVKAPLSPVEYVKQRLQKLHVDSKLAELDDASKAVDPVCKGSESNPTDSLKCALSCYLKKELSHNWLRN